MAKHRNIATCAACHRKIDPLGLANEPAPPLSEAQLADFRTVRDERYVYIRNYKPHRIYGQYIQYMFQTPTTAKWKEMYDAGELNEAQSHFWETKPAEELYDLQADPDEVNNLAGDPAHAARVERMRDALYAWQRKIRDVGFLPFLRPPRTLAARWTTADSAQIRRGRRSTGPPRPPRACSL